jgi:pentatricopeptide repeat protein
MLGNICALKPGSILELRLDARTLLPRRPRHGQQLRTPVCSSLPPKDSTQPSESVPWTEDARTAVTDAVIRGFLASTAREFSGKPQGGRGGGRGRGGAANKQRGASPRPGRGAPPSPNGSNHGDSTKSKDGIGAQALIVGHLLAGNFDEQILSAAPTTTLNWSIKTLGKQGHLDIAEQLFHWMRIRNMANEHSFVKLCEACEEARSPSKALLTWRNTRRLPTSFMLGERSAAALLKTYRKVGDLEGALRILDELSTSKTLSINQYAFNVVLRCAADQGDITAAMEIVEKLRVHPNSQCDARTFSALLSAVVASQRWSRTSAVHKLLQEESVQPDATLYLQLIACYAGAGRPETAEAVLDSMIDNGLRPARVHWNALLSSYAQARRYEGCLSAYTRMTDVAGIRPDQYTMVALLHGAAGARGGVTAASRVLGLMQQHDIAMNIEIGTALIACCRHSPPGQERRRSVEFSHGVLSILQSAGVKPNIKTYNSLMAVQFDAQDYVGVRETLDALESSEEVEPNDATWNIALGAFQAAGFFDKVMEVENLRETWRTLHGK